MVVLSETKCSTISYPLIRRIWGMGNFNFVASNALNATGGILVSWDQQTFVQTSSVVHDHWVAVQGSFISESFACVVIGIYNTGEIHLQDVVWSELLSYFQQIGDF